MQISQKDLEGRIRRFNNCRVNNKNIPNETQLTTVYFQKINTKNAFALKLIDCMAIAMKGDKKEDNFAVST